MTVLSATLALLTGAAWFAGVTHFIVGVRQSFNPTNLSFALLALLAGSNILTFVWVHHAPDVPHYVAAMRWSVSTGALALAVLPWFAHFYTGGTRRWIPLSLSVLYVAVAVANALLPYGLFFDALPGLARLELPWGEIATNHTGISSGVRAVAFWLMHACTFTYICLACIAQYRRGQRSHAVALAVNSSFVALTLLGNIAMALAEVPSLFFTPFAFAALVLLMMFWLSSDERFHSLFAQASEGIFIADGNGRYVDVNAAGTALLRYTREEMLQMNVFDIVAPQDVAGVERAKANLLNGDVVRSEWQFRRKDGSTFTGELSGKMLSDGRLLGLVRDVSSHKQLMRGLEERVAARTAEYAELNRQLESFSYSVSHDLRAPVRAIAGFSNILLHNHAAALDEEGRRHLTRIDAAAGHMNELIEGLLQLAQVSHQTLQNEEVDLSELARHVLHRLRERDPARRVTVVCPESLGAQGDGRLLAIVLHNLFENAWKYTSRTADARIELACDSSRGETIYSVRDNGAGFDMRYAERLFEPFQRLHSATEFSGTGIGLATVARVVQRHGGRIWARAAPGEGATFFFTLTGHKQTAMRDGIFQAR